MSDDLLTMPPGVYRGLVKGKESGECSAVIRVTTLPGGCLAADYEATSERAGLQHIEHTTIAPSGLYVAHVEGEDVRHFTETAGGVYVCQGPEPYILEIHARFADDELTWAWHWGAPGAEPPEMSRAVCRLAPY